MIYLLILVGLSGSSKSRAIGGFEGASYRRLDSLYRRCHGDHNRIALFSIRIRSTMFNIATSSLRGLVPLRAGLFWRYPLEKVPVGPPVHSEQGLSYSQTSGDRPLIFVAINQSSQLLGGEMNGVIFCESILVGKWTRNGSR